LGSGLDDCGHPVAYPLRDDRKRLLAEQSSIPDPRTRSSYDAVSSYVDILGSLRTGFATGDGSAKGALEPVS
jgi:hypothetical protein